VLFVGWLWLFLCILPVYLGTPYAFSNKTFLTYQKKKKQKKNNQGNSAIGCLKRKEKKTSHFLKNKGVGSKICKEFSL
jgi:hypothetical protein